MAKQDELPRPVTAGEMYLQAVLAELRALRADLARVPSFVGGAPAGASTSSASGQGAAQGEKAVDAEVFARKHLPDDFPGLQALQDAGIRRLREVPRTKADLTAIKGIGPVTAAEILKELGT